MTSPDYILKIFADNPDFRFYDILTPSKSLVESCDNDSLTNGQAVERLKDAFSNLNGTYIVKIRARARKTLNAGGDIKGSTFEYTTNLGGNISNNQSSSGIGYLEQANNERINGIQQDFNHQMEMFKKDLEIKDLKEKLKAKNDDQGLSGMDQMIAAGLMKSLGIDPTAFMGVSQPMVVNGVAPIAPNIESNTEDRIIAAIDSLSQINPNFCELIENLTATLKIHPEMIDKINKFFQLTKDGQPLMTAFQVFM